MAATSFKLNTGQDMPAVGFGTWQAEPGKVQTAVEYALKDGYTLVDGAYCYGNEDEVGEGLKAAFDSGVKREDVFVMTKVWATYNTRCELALDKSLKSLGLDHVDLFLVVSDSLQLLLQQNREPRRANYVFLALASPPQPRG